MTTTMDVSKVVKDINAYLGDHGFKPRDADGQDFQFGHDTSLRFKTGTSRGEVAIQVIGHGHVRQVIRVLHENRIAEAKHEIDRVIASYRGEDNVHVIEDGAGNVVTEYEA